MAKCCCAPEIGAAKNEVLRALSKTSLPVVQQGSGSTIDIPVELIARRVADLLYPQQNTFQQTVLRELSAIIQALTALKGKDSDRDLLLLIARTANDIYTQNAGNYRDLSLQLATKSTQAQVRDLLFAIVDSRKFVVNAVNASKVAVLAALGAISFALAAISAFALASKVAILAAIAAATARILAAISALKLQQPVPPNLGPILDALTLLSQNSLGLSPITLQVPSCQVGVGGIPTIVYQDVDSFAITDGNGNTTAATDFTVNSILQTLLVDGVLQCGQADSGVSETILSMGAAEDDNTVHTAFPTTLIPEYFVLVVESVNPAYIRTYKLAGAQSEYGAGNWSIIDLTGAACHSFTHIYSNRQRLDVPVSGAQFGVRVSPKIGVSFRVIAFGDPIS